MPIRLDELEGTTSTASPGQLPLQLQSAAFGPRGASVRMAPQKSTVSQPTESERASTRIAKIGLNHIQRLRQLLEIGGTAEKPTMTHRSPITPSVNSPLPFDPTVIRNPMVRDPEKKQLRDDIENAISLLALLRTGKAGESAQIHQIRSTSTIGQSEQNDPKTVARRLNDLETEFRGFATGEIVSPLDQRDTMPTISSKGQSEMDRLLGQ